MALLKVFLKLLVNKLPELWLVIREVLDSMSEAGHFTQEVKKKIISEIAPDKHEDIDRRLDDEVANRFPADPESAPAQDEIVATTTVEPKPEESDADNPTG